MPVIAKKQKLGSILRCLHDGPEIRQNVQQGVSSYYYKDYGVRTQVPRINLSLGQLIIPANLTVDVDVDQMVVTFSTFQYLNGLSLKGSFGIDMETNHMQMMIGDKFVCPLE